MARTTSLPVLMYHYVSRFPDSISVSPECFAEHCEILARNNWKGISLAEAEAYFLYGEDLPPKSCLITFDDGYLDNYVYAWPILQKYGHKAVIFAVSGKMDSTDIIRPTIRNVWNNSIAPEDLPRVDAPFLRHPDGYEVRTDLFFSWAEARAMGKSGVISVASHSYGHQGVFINDDYRGFFLPGRKGTTFHDPEQLFWGLPSFVMGPGLLERAFVPDPELCAAIRKLVPQDEVEAFAFAQNKAGMDELESLTEQHGRLGRMETDEEMAKRIQRDIGEGKSILENGLGHQVTSLCWPWGAYGPLALKIGQQLGFKVFFTTKTGANPPDSPLAVRRFKAKSRPGSWLLNRVRVYGIPLLAELYAGMQFKPSIMVKKKRKDFVVRRQAFSKSR